MAQEQDWRSMEFRQKVMGQIDDAVRASGNPTTKTSEEMENHVFTKASNREAYLVLVAKLILHVRELNSKDDSKSREFTSNRDTLLSLQQNISAGGHLMQPNSILMQSSTGIPVQSIQTPQQGINPTFQSPRQPIIKTELSVASPNTFKTAGSPQQQSPMRSDDQAYLDKVKQLQKYNESLHKTMGQLKDDPTSKKKEMQKLISLMEALKDTTKRIPLDVLNKCETILEKIHQQHRDSVSNQSPPVNQQSSTTPQTTQYVSLQQQQIPTTATVLAPGVHATSQPPKSSPSTGLSSHFIRSQHHSQPLTEAVALALRYPLANHTLFKTFAPVVAGNFWSEYGSSPDSRPPCKKMKPKMDGFLPDRLQGEVTRLYSGKKFKISFTDPTIKEFEEMVEASKDTTATGVVAAPDWVTLEFDLDLPHLPAMPPISIRIPHNYPDSPPVCRTFKGDLTDDGNVVALSLKYFSNRIEMLPERHSLSVLLREWEASVENACSTLLLSE